MLLSEAFCNDGETIWFPRPTLLEMEPLTDSNNLIIDITPHGLATKSKAFGGVGGRGTFLLYNHSTPFGLICNQFIAYLPLDTPLLPLSLIDSEIIWLLFDHKGTFFNGSLA